ncbi:MAG: hypothetical protein AAF611_07865 [Bacteroidota bacterium]
MKHDDYLEIFETQQGAVDRAMWLNFKYRLTDIRFGVIHGKDNDWATVEKITADEMGVPFLDVLPDDYSQMTYLHIQNAKLEHDLLRHLQNIVNIFSKIDSELLLYVIYSKMPLEKLLRYELASRKRDEKNRWCGFEKAKEIWCAEN